LVVFSWFVIQGSGFRLPGSVLRDVARFEKADPVKGGIFLGAKIGDRLGNIPQSGVCTVNEGERSAAGFSFPGVLIDDPGQFDEVFFAHNTSKRPAGLN
jgi:hypothetical protein